MLFLGAIFFSEILSKFRNETRFLLPKTIETEELEIVMCICVLCVLTILYP